MAVAGAMIVVDAVTVAGAAIVVGVASFDCDAWGVSSAAGATSGAEAAIWDVTRESVTVTAFSLGHKGAFQGLPLP